MKCNPWYRKIFFSSWLLAFVPAAILMFFIEPAGLKYSLETERTKNIYFQILYSDLNSDTLSEVITSFRGTSYDFLVIKTGDSKIYDQWNLPDSLDPNISGIITGDYDKDKFSEIYVFSYSYDSLFLNIYEILDPQGIQRNHIFISRIGKFRGKVESYLYNAGFFDRNGDGFREFYFAVSSGFNLGPRRIFSYNVASGETDISPETHIIPYLTKMADADNDKRPEIFGNISAAGNFRPDVPYSDSSTWFMVFNDELEFEFMPVEFPGFGNILEVQPYNMSYAVLHWAGGTDPAVLTSRIMLYSTDGKLLKSRLLSELGYSEKPGLFVFNDFSGDKLYLVGKRVTELNGNLDIVEVFHIPFESEFYPRRADINNDGKDEMLFYSEMEEMLIVFNRDMELLAETSFVALPAYGWKLSYQITGEQYRTVIQSGDSVYYLTFTKNRFYYLSLLRYPGIYVAFLLFIALVRRINTLQVVQKEDLKQRLLSLQLYGIKAQLDPHFTFNTLNSVASLIYQRDHQNAYDYMNKFTQLLRMLLNDADKVYRTLAEEINFVTTYFELEKLRFGDKFAFTIETDSSVTCQEMVPKLVIFTFAENALKHGIIPKNEGGIISIRITREEGHLKIIVGDNGIGRAKAAEQPQTTAGKGLKLTGEFYEILSRMNQRPVSYKIIDLYDNDGNPQGTSVEIIVPLGLGILAS